MKEIEVDDKWVGTDVPVATLETTGEFEALLEGQSVIITLLMRLYDIEMANLSFVNKAVADQLYDAHARGEHSNPAIYIPVKVEE